MKLLLVLTNFTILSFLGVLMADHFNASHNLSSWSTSFHLLTFAWLSIRGSFWLITMTSTQQWSAFSFYFLYWMPNPLEFASFMLLPLFFAQILYPVEWKKYWGYVQPVYIAVIAALIIFQALWAFLAALDSVSAELPGINTRDSTILIHVFVLNKVVTLVCELVNLVFIISNGDLTA